jgi:DNA-binding NarL/FixJ family response regulator
MIEPRTPRIIVVDDHRVIHAGLSASVPQLDVVASYTTVEELLDGQRSPHDAILLDLRLDSPSNVTARGSSPLMGTAAVRTLLDAGLGPVIIYSSVAEDMVIAGCLAAGAMGAASKAATGNGIAEVVRNAIAGRTWVDPTIAGALSAFAHNRHAGSLSAQQAEALRFRAQGLTQQTIASRIGVKDQETVHRYLRAAVDKLADHSFAVVEDAQGRHPGHRFDELARMTGLAGDLVRWEDIEAHRRRTVAPRRPGRRR